MRTGYGIILVLVWTSTFFKRGYKVKSGAKSQNLLGSCVYGTKVEGCRGLRGPERDKADLDRTMHRQ